MGALNMEKKELSSDAYQWMYSQYIKDDPDAGVFLKELKIQADLAGQVYRIRNKLGMTHEQLARLAGLTAEDIEDIEETDYEGSWDDAIQRINTAFRAWFHEVILPAAQMTEEDYSVRVANA
jgi:DNA-binding XRE family transcriptional regulator